MRQTSTLLALVALGSPAAAWRRVAREESWTPPQETAVLAQGNQEDLDFAGFSPRPTQAPQHVGRMQLFPRLEGYSLEPGTCGFVQSDGRGYTCRESTAICSRSGEWEGCCEPNKECSIMKTTCINLAASQTGACNLPDDFHTLCCGSSSAPACFTWYISSTASDDDDDETFTILGCGATAGTGILIDYDPEWSKTHVFTSAPSSSGGRSSTTATETTSSAAATTTAAEKKDDGPPVGAIAGGTVGGVAVIAILAVVGFLFWRRKKKANAAGTPQVAAANTTQSPPQNMSQMNSTPSQSFSPVTPVAGGSMYPSTVSPSNSQYQPQGYDPRMSYQQSAYTPQPGYGQYPPQQGYDQQQGYNNVGGYAPTNTTGSPPPQFSHSPGIPEGQGVPPAHHQQQPAMELPANNPVGHATNRAELS